LENLELGKDGRTRSNGRVKKETYSQMDSFYQSEF